MPAYFESGLMVGESAWHKQGNVIPADDDRRFSIADSLELSGLDWRVSKADIAYGLGDQFGIVPGYYATVRTMADGSTQPLGVVGDRYEVLQNHEAFEWFQPWLDTKEVAIETAGSLKGGRNVWVMARVMRDPITLPGGDKIAKFLMLSTSHDGNESTRVGFTPVRVVCSNTLAMATNDKAAKLLRVRHTAGQQDSLAQIRATIDLIDQEFVATGQQYGKLLDTPINYKDLRQYVKVVCDIDPEVHEADLSGKALKRVNRICDLAMSGMGQDASDLTVWSAYNGFTQYLTHEAGKDAETRLASATYTKLNKRALSVGLQLAS